MEAAVNEGNGKTGHDRRQMFLDGCEKERDGGVAGASSKASFPTAWRSAGRSPKGAVESNPADVPSSRTALIPSGLAVVRKVPVSTTSVPGCTGIESSGGEQIEAKAKAKGRESLLRLRSPIDSRAQTVQSRSSHNETK